MIYFIFNYDRTLKAVVYDTDEGEVNGQDLFATFGHDLVEGSNESKHTWDRVEQLAAMATALEESKKKGDVFLPVDRGAHTSPRYSVTLAPKIGVKVSRGFNGDYTPVGSIIKVSETYRRVETDTGEVFYRKGKTETWKSDGTWSMVAGWHNDKNPEY